MNMMQLTGAMIAQQNARNIRNGSHLGNVSLMKAVMPPNPMANMMTDMMLLQEVQKLSDRSFEDGKKAVICPDNEEGDPTNPGGGGGSNPDDPTVPSEALTKLIETLTDALGGLKDLVEAATTALKDQNSVEKSASLPPNGSGKGKPSA